MELYDSNGYCDIPEIMKLKTPFIFILGGRGTGKTYGILKWLFDNETKFFYLRRTQKEIDAMKNDALNPFNALKQDDPRYMTRWQSIGKDTLAVYKTDENGNRLTTLGVAGALSTFSNIRGFDASEIQVLWFEEFIPEKHKAKIRHEADGFFNAVETINRNRELKGQDPVKVILTANSNELNNPIFVYSRLVLKAEQMKRKGQNFSQDPERGYSLILLDDSPISKKKKETALYKFIGNSEFTKMSLENDFAYNDMTNIKSVSLNDYECIYSVGELGIYQHKRLDRYYVCEHVRGQPSKYGTSETELLRFARNAGKLWIFYIEGMVDFETYYCKALFEQYFDK